MSNNNLCIDGLNLLHRARTGVNLGKYGIVYQFLRSLRSMIEQFNPDNVYFVLEGNPQERKELCGEYKANRVIDKELNEDKWNAQQDFFAQVQISIGIIRQYLPINVIFHHKYEADDTIANLVLRGKDDNWTIVSTDSDFIQLTKYDNVKLYNPIKKAYIVYPEYDYVIWKSLRGDMTDNIVGFAGIGDKKAEKLALDNTLLSKFLDTDNNRDHYERNMKLIAFHVWDDATFSECTHSICDNVNWQQLRTDLIDLGFNSYYNDKTFSKFAKTFDKKYK